MCSLPVSQAETLADYSVLAVTPTDEDCVPDYLPAANALLKKHGGKHLARTSSHGQSEGEAHDAALRMVIEWPFAEAAKASMSDPEYVPHLSRSALLDPTASTI